MTSFSHAIYSSENISFHNKKIAISGKLNENCIQEGEVLSVWNNDISKASQNILRIRTGKIFTKI